MKDKQYTDKRHYHGEHPVFGTIEIFENIKEEEMGMHGKFFSRAYKDNDGYHCSRFCNSLVDCKKLTLKELRSNAFKQLKSIAERYKGTIEDDDREKQRLEDMAKTIMDNFPYSANADDIFFEKYASE